MVHSGQRNSALKMTFSMIDRHHRMQICEGGQKMTTCKAILRLKSLGLTHMDIGMAAYRTF